MGVVDISGVALFPLNIIQLPDGDVLHGLKQSDSSFHSFGEAYFSTVKQHSVKAWKKHLEMTLNLVVPVGKIKFVIHDDREESPTRGCFREITLSRENYCRLVIDPGLWFGFTGLDAGINLLLNIADIEHDPDEVRQAPPDRFPWRWS